MPERLDSHVIGADMVTFWTSVSAIFRSHLGRDHWDSISSSVALAIHTLHEPPRGLMTSSYVVFPPAGYTPPSFSGFKPLGRDKLGLHGIFQQSQQRQLHSLSAADAAHADFPHFT